MLAAVVSPQRKPCSGSSHPPLSFFFLLLFLSNTTSSCSRTHTHTHTFNSHTFYIYCLWSVPLHLECVFADRTAWRTILWTQRSASLQQGTGENRVYLHLSVFVFGLFDTFSDRPERRQFTAARCFGEKRHLEQLFIASALLSC